MSQLPPIVQSPYAPPQVSAPQGLWRDGNQLVAHAQAQFPDRCVKTSQASPGYWHDVKLDHTPNQLMWTLLFGRMGAMIAKSVSGRTLFFRVALQPEWYAQHTKSKWIGWSIVIVGLVLLIAGTFGYGFLSAADVPEEKAVWAIFGGLVGLPLALFGAIYLALFHKSILKIRRVQDDYAWLNGADAEFLESLPPWPY